MQNTIDAAVQEGFIPYSSIKQLSNLSIEQLFQMFQIHFTSPDQTTRQKASTILLQILKLSPNLSFTSDQLSTITRFFITKLNDTPCVEQVSSILAFLMTFPQSEDTFQAFTSKINSDIFYVPNYPQIVRYNVYKTLLLTDPTPQLLLRVAESEKDPRNIIVVFNLFQKVLPNELYNSRIFEFLEAYYPIDFNPKVKKQLNLTPSLIQDQLNLCLVQLVPQVYELIIENMTSGSEVPQEAALSTLRALLRHREDIDEGWLRDLWTNMQLVLDELLSDEVQQGMARTIASLLGYLGGEAVVVKWKVSFIYRVVEYLEQMFLENPLTQKAMIVQSSLQQAVGKSRNLSYLIVNRYVRLFNDHLDLDRQEPAAKLLEVLLLLLLAAKQQHVHEYPGEQPRLYCPQSLLQVDRDQADGLHPCLQESLHHRPFAQDPHRAQGPQPPGASPQATTRPTHTLSRPHHPEMHRRLLLPSPARSFSPAEGSRHPSLHQAIRSLPVLARLPPTSKAGSPRQSPR